MPPPPHRPSSYQPSLDGLRAVAILMVIAYHDRALRGGFLGVQLFFVLSGYLITTLLQREQEDTGSIRLGRFYGRRFLRLAPALCLFVVVAWIVTHGLRPSLSGWLEGSWALAALFYVSNLVIAFGREYPLGVVSICWSLALEEQFYLLWPATLRVLNHLRASWRGTAVLLAGLIAACLGLREALLALGGGDPELWLRVYFGPDTSAEGLLWGCLLALALRRVGAAPFERVAGLGALVAAGILAWLATRVDIIDLVARPILLTSTAVLSVLLIIGALTRGPFRRVLELPVLVWIGQLSYSLYLWHAFAIDLFVHEPRWRRHAFMLGMAAASHYLVERPVQTLARRWGALARPHPWSRPGDQGEPASSRRVRWEAAAGLTMGVAGLALAIALGSARLAGIAVPGFGLPADVRAREHYAEGVALFHAQRSEEAGAAFHRAIALDPKKPDAHLALAALLLGQGRNREAIPHLSQAAALQPGDAAIRNELGVALAMEGRFDAAIAQFQASLSLGAGPDVRENLARAVHERDRMRSGPPR